ncbi:HsmA family protein [Pelolinea submarina]|uniref:Putative repeat protein (TIGR03987 family) n=1 Tax=Pelolinea submarina TaxID=913107 RepID=A0A347ZPG7_9CHLR|nr:HsmA family protein [Pelolinea submarina]REG04788.1 putative repeat protein (TIGR03987 family) [Pelolinea submarina]BBB47198.1 hypothetical protein Pelsub_P0425 [Pelolinea submarina]
MDFFVAIVAISLALVFYTLGVWSEKFAGRLRGRHLVLFWVGLVFDTTGTTMMGEIAGGLDFNLHGVTGVLAIILMLGHALWATLVFLRKNEQKLRDFHKFSLFVWLMWLVPYFTGMIAAMAR